ncbi:MAG: hypothetical protein IJC50_02510 [Clostridia bacterium]|nr:hypothetical protein [Clostridia bacterium]
MKKIILCSSSLNKNDVYLLGNYADSVVRMPSWDKVPGGIGYHPDMLGFSRGNKLWLNDEYYGANSVLFDSLGADIRLCAEPYGKYPDDVRFNAFNLGDTLFGRADSIAAELKADFASIVNLRQGYSKCSTAVFGNSVITSDHGIARVVAEYGADVLYVDPGTIVLEGYGYGFIGGALVCVSDDTLVSFGDIRCHEQGEEVLNFAAERGFKIVGCGSAPICDYGGILVLYV